MSVTAAHRPHIHLPYKSIAIFAVAAAVAALALILVNQPWESEQTATVSTGSAATQAVAVPQPESWSMLRAHPELIPAGEAGVRDAKTQIQVRHNLVVGTMLNGEPAYVAQPAAPWYAPGTVSNARPLNFTASGTR